MITTSDMVFDETRKRFRLTNDYVYNELGTDLANALIDDFDTNLSTIAERTLSKTSNKLYDFLNEHKLDYGENGNSYKTAQYMIATDEDWYYAFRDALAEQLFFFAGAGDVGGSTGINLETGTRINKGFRDTVCDNAIAIMQAQGMFHTVIKDIPAVEEW